MISDKDMEEAENRHYDFQVGCYFSNSKNIEGASLFWNDKISDSFWNYATKINTDQGSLEYLIKIVPKYKDAWMFYKKSEPKIILPENFVIKEVKTKDEMKIFVRIFHQAYGGASPEEPYGALPKEYGECLIDSFLKPQKGKIVVNYLGFLGSKPISIATLIYSGNFGCIYNVGTIPDYRGRGFGATLSLNAVADSVKNNAKIVFLQTEEGSFNEKYYANLGFSTKFICEGFVLE